MAWNICTTFPLSSQRSHECSKLEIWISSMNRLTRNRCAQLIKYLLCSDILPWNCWPANWHQNLQKHIIFATAILVQAPYYRHEAKIRLLPIFNSSRSASTQMFTKKLQGWRRRHRIANAMPQAAVILMLLCRSHSQFNLVWILIIFCP